MHDWMLDGWGMGLGFIFWVAILQGNFADLARRQEDGSIFRL